MDYIDQMVRAASLKLQRELAFAVEWNRKAMGMPVRREIQDAALQKETQESPLYVAGIYICGQVARNMYDEHPGLAYFYTEAVRRVDVPDYCGIERAKQMAVEAFARIEEDGGEATDDECDGDFSPQYIVLRDQFGDALLEFARGGWITGFPPPSAWASTFEAAAECDRDAAEEARWDNFESAKRLRARAAALRRSVQCAEAINRCIY
jgi:hypothetical protein